MKHVLNRRAIAWCMLAVPVGVIGVAGVGKSLDIPSFLLSLRTWQLIPTSFLAPLALILPPIEVAVALAWFLGFSTRWAVLIAAVLLISFTSVYVAHLLWHIHPSCQCSGAIQVLLQIRREAPAIITQNTALILCLGLGVWLRRAGENRATAMPPVPSSTSITPAPIVNSTQPRGFTLIELLLAIAIVGILVALTAPSLTRVRSAAREQASLANISSHVKIFHVYTSDWKDQLPFFTIPNATWTIVRNPDQNIAVKVPFFGAHFTWNIALASMYYNGNHRSDSFTSPDNQQGRGGGRTDYYYPCAAIAAPRFWNPRSREGPAQRVPTTNSDVLFPDKKGILIEVSKESDPFDDPGTTLLRTGTVDGSARALRPSQLTGSGMIGADGRWPGAMHGGAGWPPLHHTLDGMRGRDIR